MEIFLDTGNVREIREEAKLGADAAAFRFNVLEQWVKRPLTDRGLDRFLTDWQKFQNNPALHAS